MSMRWRSPPPTRKNSSLALTRSNGGMGQDAPGLRFDLLVAKGWKPHSHPGSEALDDPHFVLGGHGSQPGRFVVDERLVHGFNVAPPGRHRNGSDERVRHSSLQVGASLEPRADMIPVLIAALLGWVGEPTPSFALLEHLVRRDHILQHFLEQTEARQRRLWLGERFRASYGEATAAATSGLVGEMQVAAFKPPAARSRRNPYDCKRWWPDQTSGA